MKEKNIYNRNGFINIPAIYNIPVPFIFIVGGRGTGKTYGVCKFAIEKKIKFALMRRTQTQADLISKPEFSPLKPVLGDMNRMFKAVSLTKQNSAFYETDMEGTIISPEPFCYSLALSTISNMRGFDASDISLIFYDEFIAEAHERPLKNEAEAFFNCYETINRNRELKGIPPVKVICAANSNNMANELFISLGMVLRAEKMYRNGTSIWIDKERGLALIICGGMPISGFSKGFAVIGQGYVGIVPIPVIIMIICFAIGSFILNKTYFGRYFYAVGGNVEAAKLSGIRVSRIKYLVFAISGFFAGLAGIVMLSRTASGNASSGADGFEFEVITCVVLGGVSVTGGVGRMSGVVAGTFIIGALKNGMVLMNVNSYVQKIVMGVVLALAVGFDCMQNKKRAN